MQQARRVDYVTNCGHGFAGLECNEVMSCEELDYCSGHGMCQRGGLCICDPGWTVWINSTTPPSCSLTVFHFHFHSLACHFHIHGMQKCKYVWVCACASDWCCFDWCCFYYFIWNCLEALLGALFTRLCACLRVCPSWRARKVEAVSMGSFSCQLSSCHTQSISSHRGLRAFNQIVPVCALVFLSFFLPLSCRLTLFLPLAPSDEENALLWHHLCVCVCVC